MGNNGSTNAYPVHVLGNTYNETDEAKLKIYTETLFRFTYRRGMPALCGSGITSDAGWGCMLRAAQMLMGNTLQRHHLGKEWRIPPDVQASRVRQSRLQALAANTAYCELVRWFSDYPGAPHLYSLHHLVHLGAARYDKPAGQWVGPSTAAYMLRDLARIHCALHGGTMEVLVTQGDTIYISEAQAVCTRTPDGRAQFAAHLRVQQQQQQQAAGQGSSEGLGLHPLLCEAASAGSSQGPASTEESAGDGVVVDGNLSVLSDCSDDGIAAAAISEKSDGGHNAPKIEKHHPAAPPVSAPPASTGPEPAAAAGGGFFDPLLRPPPQVRPPWTSALLVLIPLRLGIHSVNREYYEEIKEALRHRNCVGILGGRPNHAIYFVGYRGDCLLGLDPHTVFPNAPRGPPPSPAHTGAGTSVQPIAPHVPPGASEEDSLGAGRPRLSSSSSAPGRNTSSDRCAATGPQRTAPLRTSYDTSYVSSSSGSVSTSDSFFTSAFAGFGAYPSDTSSEPEAFPSAEYLSQVHVQEFVHLEISRLDPSLALGFYFATQGEFDAFCEQTRATCARKLKAGASPLYSVQSTAPAFMYSGEEEFAGSGKAAGEDGETMAGTEDGGGTGRVSSFDPSDVDDVAGVSNPHAGPRRKSGSGRAGTGAGALRESESSDEDYVLV